MPTFEIWAGQEIVHLRRFGAILSSARQLVGRDDHLANLLLEDALAELDSVLGDAATGVGVATCAPTPRRWRGHAPSR